MRQACWAGGGARWRREGPRQDRPNASWAIAIALLLLPLAGACGGNPPQIIDYAPQRGAVDVSTAAPIRITFDHAVDPTSVESRLHLVPATNGIVQWVSARQLTYEHPTLRPSTPYEVVLDAGYRDLAGNAYTLRHHWAFITEGPPGLVGTTPSNADTSVDPATYLALDFTREMNGASLKGAITINPTVSFSVRLDPTDARRAIVAPAGLLAPNTTYSIAVNTSALDADGNQLERDENASFTTGAVRPLKHWVAFATDGAGGAPRGLWIVQESGFPRQLFDASAVRSFSWSPDGSKLLIEGDGNTWSELTPGSGSVALGFKATWAAALASGFGYVYLDDTGALHRLSADGVDDVIATDVEQAALAPGGLRLAFVHASTGPNNIWGFDVGLHATYQLAADTAGISAISWAPAGNRIAYLRSDVGSTTLRVRSLTGTGATTTIAGGDIGAPAWLPDSTHVVFAAATQTATGITHKAFVIDVVSPPAALTPASGLPSDPGVDLSAPVPSPDGHQIAFVSGNQVWIMNADGTRPTALTKFDSESFPYSCRMPAWTVA